MAWTDDYATATLMTLGLAVFSASVAIVLGLALALLRDTRSRTTQVIAASIVWVLRNTPEVPCLLFVSYLAWQAAAHLFLHSVATGVLAALTLGMLLSAVASETWRAGFRAMPTVEHESAKALGLTFAQTLFLLRIPHAFQSNRQGWANLWSTCVKATALISVLSLHDLMRTAEIAAQTTAQPLVAFAAAAICYFALIHIGVSWLLSEDKVSPAPLSATVWSRRISL